MRRRSRRLGWKRKPGASEAGEKKLEREKTWTGLCAGVEFRLLQLHMQDSGKVVGVVIAMRLSTYIQYSVNVHVEGKLTDCRVVMAELIHSGPRYGRMAAMAQPVLFLFPLPFCSPTSQRNQPLASTSFLFHFSLQCRTLPCPVITYPPSA
ncbi:hypothetical protein BO71DRAFT_394404 [Aspergillus ellipticus CBS 707.79]|uniref:Uncharacterized protein n=1 Tax=Aspergillus ellipticus CBS 707.79 TaxID=1448320 RepID=A0A319DP44_9EURO|nr:hypothetical protein BO71DRAFT_394404 [Aspergillus ellipticus CBS 707.79]